MEYVSVVAFFSAFVLYAFAGVTAAVIAAVVCAVSMQFAA